jgi:hypothetical protein
MNFAGDITLYHGILIPFDTSKLAGDGISGGKGTFRAIN